jgi:hypothetical protein
MFWLSLKHGKSLFRWEVQVHPHNIVHTLEYNILYSSDSKNSISGNDAKSKGLTLKKLIKF